MYLAFDSFSTGRHALKFNNKRTGIEFGFHGDDISIYSIYDGLWPIERRRRLEDFTESPEDAAYLFKDIILQHIFGGKLEL